MTDDIRDYIRLIQERIIDLVPENELDRVMGKISSIVLDNWVNEQDYHLRMTQVIALVREAVGGGYNNN